MTVKHLVYVSVGLIILAGFMVQFGAGSFSILPLSAVLGIWLGYLTR